MILVDIGNSGLRAVHANQLDWNKRVDRSRLYKLSWSSIGKEILKHQPQRSTLENNRWINPQQGDGFDWLVQQLHKQQPPRVPPVWRIASVNRTALETLQLAIQRADPSAKIDVVDHRHSGIEVQVQFPERVGIDRILAARAAVTWKQLHGYPNSPIIVVQAGTALTVDLVDDHGVFQGGAILPGAGLALQYLAAGTDQLPWLPTESVHSLPTLPGKNTEQAIAAGVHASLVGGAKYLIERYRESLPKIPALISGGDGKLVQEHIPPPVAYVENLVLMGLTLCQLP